MKSLSGNMPAPPPLLPEPPKSLYELLGYTPPHPINAMFDWRPKTQWVNGHYKYIPEGLGYRLEWIAGYWRTEG